MTAPPSPEMQWAFPVPGRPCPSRCGSTSPSARAVPRPRFNVSIDGVSKLSNFDANSEAGGKNRGIMKAFTVTSDGTVNVDFGHVLAGRQPVGERSRDRQDRQPGGRHD